LKERLEKIFGFVSTFDIPAETFEQDIMFIDVLSPNCRVSRKADGSQTAKVIGAITIYTQEARVPFGFFNKRIEMASKELTRSFFFYDIDQDIVSSPARIQNIHERRTGFVFLYDSQYDPSQGRITILNLE
jgi:hypothetical protein